MPIEGICVCGGTVFSREVKRKTIETCNKCQLNTVRSMFHDNMEREWHRFGRLVPVRPWEMPKRKKKRG